MRCLNIKHVSPAATLPALLTLLVAGVILTGEDADAAAAVRITMDEART